MSEADVDAIRELLQRCSSEERNALFHALRREFQLHEFEKVIGAPAEMILEAVHRAPELTRRMLRGVIADAAFRMNVVPALHEKGWLDVTPEGNFAYDYKLNDAAGPITIQVKLQRSEKGRPVVKAGSRYGFPGEVFITETQKTRTGNDGDGEKTRPYRYGEFDVLAVSMQPSTGEWTRYMYTLGRWLIQGKTPGEIATMQPVTMTSSDFWTDDFPVVASWFRASDNGKRLKSVQRAKAAAPRV